MIWWWWWLRWWCTQILYNAESFCFLNRTIISTLRWKRGRTHLHGCFSEDMKHSPTAYSNLKQFPHTMHACTYTHKKTAAKISIHRPRILCCWVTSMFSTSSPKNKDRKGTRQTRQKFTRSFHYPGTLAASCDVMLAQMKPNCSSSHVILCLNVKSLYTYSVTIHFVAWITAWAVRSPSVWKELQIYLEWRFARKFPTTVERT